MQHESAGRTQADAVALAILAVACFAALDTTTKWVSTAVPLLVALFVRYLIQAFSASVVVLASGGKHLLRTAHPRFHIARGVLLLLSSSLAFLSLHLMPVGEFTAVAMVTPLLVTLCAARMLGETVPRLQWLFVGGGFAGTLLIVHPGGGNFSWLLVFPLALVLVNTSFQLLTSRMARTEDPRTLQFYTSWTGAAIAGCPMLWLWTPIRGAPLWLAMAFMGLASAQGHLFLIQSFKKAAASSLMPYMYAQIAFGMLGGWLIFHHQPDVWSLVGIALIAASGVGGALLGRQRARALTIRAGSAANPTIPSLS